MNILFLFVMLFGMMTIGVPISISLGLSSMLTIMLFAQDSLASLALKFFATMDQYSLLSIPFFILGGAFITTGGVARRMITFRSEERRVGKECVSTCRSRRSSYH